MEKKGNWIEKSIIIDDRIGDVHSEELMDRGLIHIKAKIYHREENRSSGKKSIRFSRTC